jgi:Flp pilus assembly protein TadG
MRRQRRQRGATLPETALILTVLLALTFGVIDFGRAAYAYAFVAQLAREGSRWAMVRGGQCSKLDNCNAGQSQIQTYVRGLSEGATNPNNITVTATWPKCPPGSSGNSPGCVVSVSVTYPFTFMLPFLPSLQLNMSSTSQMVISQ